MVRPTKKTKEPKKPKKKAAPRRRRTAEEARAAILDAAEALLVEAGPAGIRLQEVAAAIGVSHPTVLHHFGSREALLEAVVTRAFDSLHASVVDAVRAAPEGEEQIASLLDAVYEALTARGHGRALVWLALAGYGPGKQELRLSDVARAVHEVRRAHAKDKGLRAPTSEDTAFTVLLASLALLGQAVMGPQVVRELGLEDDPRVHRRFRAWLAARIVEHFDEHAGGAGRFAT